MPVGLGLGRDHEPHYGRREGMVLMPYDPLWVGQLAGLRGRTVEPAAGSRGTRCHRQYSFRRQPEVAQRGKGVTTQTCFLPRGRRAQARSVGEGASPCQANLGVFHGRLLRRGVRAKGAGPSGRNKPAGFPLTFCLFVCLFTPTSRRKPPANHRETTARQPRPDPNPPRRPQDTSQPL